MKSFDIAIIVIQGTLKAISSYELDLERFVRSDELKNHSKDVNFFGASGHY